MLIYKKGVSAETPPVAGLASFCNTITEYYYTGKSEICQATLTVLRCVFSTLCCFGNPLHSINSFGSLLSRTHVFVSSRYSDFFHELTHNHLFLFHCRVFKFICPCPELRVVVIKLAHRCLLIGKPVIYITQFRFFLFKQVICILD